MTVGDSLAPSPSADREPVLSIRGVSKRFGAIQALTDIDLDIFVGEVVAIVGDNAEGSSDSGGTGPYGRWDGFLGPFALSDTGFYFSNGGQTLLTNTTDWRATPQPNQGSSWSAPSGAPISLGLNGAFPWGFQSGFSSQAQWIWASPDLSGETFFSTTISGAVPEPASWALMIGGFGLAGAVLRRRRAAVAA